MDLRNELGAPLILPGFAFLFVSIGNYLLQDWLLGVGDFFSVGILECAVWTTIVALAWWGYARCIKAGKRPWRIWRWLLGIGTIGVAIANPIIFVVMAEVQKRYDWQQLQKRAAQTTMPAHTELQDAETQQRNP